MYRTLGFVSLLIFAGSFSARAEIRVAVEHTAWDIRSVSKVFDNNPDSTRVKYLRDSASESGEYLLFSGQEMLEKILIPAGTSPDTAPFKTAYPKNYSRAEISQLLKELEYGDKNLTQKPHETAALNHVKGKTVYLVEMTDIEDASKLPVDKIRIFNSAKAVMEAEPVKVSGSEYLREAQELLKTQGYGALALAYFSRAERFPESLADAASELAYYDSMFGEFQSCIERATKAIKSNPHLAAAWANRGACKSKLSKFKEAKADLDRALKLRPGFASAYMTRAGTNSALKKCAAAKKDAEKAITLDPRLTEFRSKMINGCR